MIRGAPGHGVQPEKACRHVFAGLPPGIQLISCRQSSISMPGSGTIELEDIDHTLVKASCDDGRGVGTVGIDCGKRTESIMTRLVYILAFLVLGMITGFIAKYLDRMTRFPFNVLGAVSSRIGIWVFVATIIASRSRTPTIGAIRVFAFFTGMLLSYYTYSMKLFGFFPKYHFLRWGLVALLSALAAYTVWFGRGQGWMAALCAALPVGLLAAQGYSFLYTLSATPGFDLVAAITLFFALPVQKRQYLRVLPLALLVTFLARESDVLARLIGGL